MSAELVLGRIDRGLRGELIAIFHNAATPYIAFRHVERDGREGGRLVVKLDEIDALLTLLSKAKAITAGSKPAHHRTVRATQEELELDKRLF